MKVNIIIFLILCINFALSSNALTLTPKKIITIEAPDDGTIYFYFNSESINTSTEDKTLIFQITSLKNSLPPTSITYSFINSIDNIDLSSTIPDGTLSVSIDSLKLKEMTNTNGTDFQLVYFTITKTKSTTQNLIYIKFNINRIGTQKIYVEISNLEKFPETPKDDKTAPKTEHNYLKKFDSITVDAETDSFIFFDSSGFENGEEMHFKIEALEYAYIDYYSDGIYYDFINNDDPNVAYNSHYRDFSISSDYKYDSYYGESFKTKYFNIKKDSLYFNGGDGSLLSISFYFDYGPVTITNTETDEGKTTLKTWEIIVIVIAAAIIIGIAIFCCCWRRKKALQAQAAVNTQYAAQAVVADPYTQNPYPASQAYY